MSRSELKSLFNEERQVLQGLITRLQHTDTRWSAFGNSFNEVNITADDLKVMIRDIFGIETLEFEKYEALLAWLQENV